MRISIGVLVASAALPIVLSGSVPALAQQGPTLIVKRLAVDVAAPLAPVEMVAKVEPIGGAGSLFGGARFGISAAPAAEKPRATFELARLTDWTDTKTQAEARCATVAGATLCVDVPVPYVRQTTLTIVGELELPTLPSPPTAAALKECMLSLDDSLLIGALRLPAASLAAIKAAVASCLDAAKVDIAERPKPGWFSRVFGSAEPEPTDKPDFGVGLYAVTGAGEWRRAN